MRKKKEIKPQLSDYFKPDEIGPLDGDYTGRLLLLNPLVLQAAYRNRDNLLWRAQGGFGCDPTKIGRAVFATCIADGEAARWDRHDFIREYKGPVLACARCGTQKKSANAQYCVRCATYQNYEIT